MKTFVFHIFIFALVAFASASRDSAKKIGSQYEHYATCLTENDAAADDIFTILDITSGHHKNENEHDKQHKNGCVMHCLLEKDGLMTGADYHEEKIREDYIKETGAQPGDKRLEALDTCMNETKDMTDKCDKSLLLVACVLIAEDSLATSTEASTEA
uniref:Pheromone-binding protein Gp-9 n=1 Tax=Solenopsis globularia littoralis TaxID=176593 RepID=PBGP9_SOLGI|nr:RecName: Full=Pheromone-binding protein Gp-9; Short=PBP; AltName: Full=Putative odorant-binding protein Gp-9; Flags: Precursor [Solenopsis globularia littoralis]AAL51132.1 putative odorant binding protein precursor [Solenopsis globularia littoralis]